MNFRFLRGGEPAMHSDGAARRQARPRAERADADARVDAACAAPAPAAALYDLAKVVQDVQVILTPPCVFY